MSIRVGILTFLHNDNYGSALQAYALQRALLALGAQAEHMDYAPSPWEKARNLLQSGNSPRLLLEGLRKREVRAKQAGAQRKAASFQPFYERHMRLSPRCSSHDALKKQATAYDLLLCGSDQIWSPTWLNPAYFLDFAAAGQRKAAYAPSLGVKTLPSPRKQRRIARLLQGFERLSVREAEGRALLQSMLPGVDIPVLPDPVCLLTREDWLELAQMPHRKHPFILCYFLGESPAYWTRVKRLAERTGLRVKVIPGTEEAYCQPFDLCEGLSPEEFLGYLAEAAVVCTDSFHGTVFSTLLQKQFEVFRRYREEDPASRNSRIDHLLRTLELDRDEAEIPWERVSAHLGAMRQEGMAFLRTLVEEKA